MKRLSSLSSVPTWLPDTPGPIGLAMQAAGLASGVESMGPSVDPAREPCEAKMSRASWITAFVRQLGSAPS